MFFRSLRRMLMIAGTFTLLTLMVVAEPPPRSGLPPGRRPGPYTALVSVGPERGTLHCYICEAEDRPVIIVFARSLSDSLGKLVQQIDQTLPRHKDADLRAWVTLLHEDQPSFDPQVVAWAKKNALRHVPVAVFEDVTGPPAYLLARAADVTVLLSVKQQVMANYAFRTGELNDAAIQQIMQMVPKLVAGKP